MEIRTLQKRTKGEKVLFPQCGFEGAAHQKLTTMLYSPEMASTLAPLAKMICEHERHSKTTKGKKRRGGNPAPATAHPNQLNHILADAIQQAAEGTTIRGAERCQTCTSPIDEKRDSLKDEQNREEGTEEEEWREAEEAGWDAAMQGDEEAERDIHNRGEGGNSTEQARGGNAAAEQGEGWSENEEEKEPRRRGGNKDTDSKGNGESEGKQRPRRRDGAAQARWQLARWTQMAWRARKYTGRRLTQRIRKHDLPSSATIYAMMNV